MNESDNILAKIIKEKYYESEVFKKPLICDGM